MPLDALTQGKIAVHIGHILTLLGEDPYNDPHLQKTPERVAKMYSEVLDGKTRDKEAFIKKMTTFEEQEYTGIVMVHGANFYSYCAHHMALFNGQFSIGYLPSQKRILGLSKLVRIFREGCRQLTTQERITQEAIKLLSEVTLSEDVICHVRARHTCMECRGVQSHGALTTTVAYTGKFDRDPILRQQFLQEIK